MTEQEFINRDRPPVWAWQCSGDDACYEPAVIGRILRPSPCASGVIFGRCERHRNVGLGTTFSGAWEWEPIEAFG